MVFRTVDKQGPYKQYDGSGVRLIGTQAFGTFRIKYHAKGDVVEVRIQPPKGKQATGYFFRRGKGGIELDRIGHFPEGLDRPEQLRPMSRENARREASRLIAGWRTKPGQLVLVPGDRDRGQHLIVMPPPLVAGRERRVTIYSARSFLERPIYRREYIIDGAGDSPEDLTLDREERLERTSMKALQEQLSPGSNR